MYYVRTTLHSQNTINSRTIRKPAPTDTKRAREDIFHITILHNYKEQEILDSQDNKKEEFQTLTKM